MLLSLFTSDNKNIKMSIRWDDKLMGLRLKKTLVIEDVCILTQKAYKFRDTTGRKIKISRDVTFNEGSNNFFGPPLVEYKDVFESFSNLDNSVTASV